jgi:hypothetical protein
MISVIIPVGGGRKEREQRLDYYLNVTLKNQSYQDFEIIIVEQTLDNSFYYATKTVEGIMCRYITIKDPLNRGFNESWCYNLGARKATGDTLAFLGMDFVFNGRFLEDAINYMLLYKTDFMFACENCVFCGQAETDEFYQTKDVDFLLAQPGYAVFTPKRGAAVGISFVNKESYFNKYNSWVENFFGWGAHDKIFGQVIAAVNNTPMPALPFLPHKIVHLCHDRERHLDLVNSRSDELYNKCHSFGLHNIPSANKDCGQLSTPNILCLE